MMSISSNTGTTASVSKHNTPVHLGISPPAKLVSIVSSLFLVITTTPINSRGPLAVKSIFHKIGQRTMNSRNAARTAAFRKTFTSGRSQRLLSNSLRGHEKRRGPPPAWGGPDSGYGELQTFRKQLRDWNEPYILGVGPKDMQIIPESTPIEYPEDASGIGRPPSEPRYPPDATPQSPEEIADGLTDEDWTSVTWAEGTKELLSGQFFRTRVRVVKRVRKRRVTEETGWLLIEDATDELRAWLCWGVDDWSIKELAAYAHLRWSIEQFHKEAKQVLALDQFEGRSWKGWHHHVTMVLLTYAFVAAERAAHGAAARPPPFPKVARTLVYEMATQIAESEGLELLQAQEVGEAMVKGLTDW